MEEGVGEDDSSAAIGFCATSKHVKERRAVEVRPRKLQGSGDWQRLADLFNRRTRAWCLVLFAERLDGRRGGHARSDSYLGLAETGRAKRGAGLVGAIAD